MLTFLAERPCVNGNSLVNRTPPADGEKNQPGRFPNFTLNSVTRHEGTANIFSRTGHRRLTENGSTPKKGLFESPDTDDA